MARGDLKGIIRFSSFNVDEIRRELGALLSREADVMDRQTALETEFVAEREMAGKMEGGLLTFEAYFQAYRQRRADLAAALTKVRGEIDTVQDRLSEAYKELKTFELTQQNRKAREQAEEDRKERIVLDEMGQNLFRRKADKLGGK